MENRDNQQAISDFDLGWLIGILDGEGSMGIRFWSANETNRKNVGMKPIINICNCNLDVMLKVRDILDRMMVGHNDDTTITSSGKEMYRSTISGMLRCRNLLNLTMGRYVRLRAHSQLLDKYIQKRLSLPRRYPYTEEDLLTAEELSALNGHKAKKSLRDRMQENRPGRFMIQSELTGDSKNPAEMVGSPNPEWV